MAEQTDRLSLITEVASAYMRGNSLGQAQIGSVISSVTRAIDAAARTIAGESISNGGETNGATTAAEKPTPAVSIRSSVKPDSIACLECGTRHKTLKRHLGVAHSLTPDQYRAKWALKKDYPLTAPSYSERRSLMAKKIGLGGQRRGRGRRKVAAR